MEQMIHLMNALATLVGKDIVIEGARLWLVLKESEAFLAAHPGLSFGMAGAMPAPPAPAAHGAALCATPAPIDLPEPEPEPLAVLAAMAATAAPHLDQEFEDELEQLATAVAEAVLVE